VQELLTKIMAGGLTFFRRGT